MAEATATPHRMPITIRSRLSESSTGVSTAPKRPINPPATNHQRIAIAHTMKTRFHKRKRGGLSPREPTVQTNDPKSDARNVVARIARLSRISTPPTQYRIVPAKISDRLEEQGFNSQMQSSFGVAITRRCSSTGLSAPEGRTIVL